jgi:hypothetical protein
VWNSHKELVCSLVLKRLELLKSVDLASDPVFDDPVYLVKCGFVDPVRVFVKNEPHTIEKLNEGRYRLIFSVSLVDNIIERLLFTPQNKNEISEYRTCPSKPGIGFGNEMQLEEMVYLVRAHIRDAAEADIRGWDWNVKEWMMKADAERRIRLSGQPSNSVFARMVRNRLFLMCRMLIATSTGRLFSKRVACFIPSGSYLTSSSGSFMRNLLVALICIQSGVKWWSVSMGDDCLEMFIANAEELYLRFGFALKMYRKCEDGFEFCSHKFDDHSGYLLSINKGTNRLLNNEMQFERLLQWKENFKNHPLFDLYNRVVCSVWQGPISDLK